MIKKILNRKEFISKPPVLLEVGASGKIHESWKKIAKHSICIAFDADLRDFSTEKSNSKYKKLILINKIVSNRTGKAKFYLTKEPHCSSALDTDMNSLQHWLFRDKFVVEGQVEVDAITINAVLDTLGFEYLDWFKTDSQGTDLRIFKEIRKSIREKLLVAEFEPGIIDGYKDEDKLHSILEFMNDDFFVDEIKLVGAHRVKPETVKKHFSFLTSKHFNKTHSVLSKESKIFANVTYLNNIEDKGILNKRDVLLFLVVLLLREQYLFCLEVSAYYYEEYQDPIFTNIYKHCKRKIALRSLRLIYKIPYLVFRKFQKSYL